jgi:hypothetical protein
MNLSKILGSFPIYEVIPDVEAPNTRINDFISRIDLTKDHHRKIMTMTRLKTRDYVVDSRKKVEKEYTSWDGINHKDGLENSS